MKARVLNHIMYLDPEDQLISKNLFNNKGHELNETALVLKTLKKGDVAIDIGAHIGYFTLIMARCVGRQGKTYAFEPSPRNFKLLQKNVDYNGYKNATLIPKAVSDRSEEATLYLNPGNTGNNMLFKRTNNVQGIRIETISLDNYFSDIDFNIDFIKIDVEGSEPLVINGMKKILEEFAYINLMIEFFPQLLRVLGFDPRAFLVTLRELGFKLYFIEKGKLKAFNQIASRYINHLTWHKNIYCESMMRYEK